jgi:hypothetical protein
LPALPVRARTQREIVRRAIRTWELSVPEGSPYRRLVERARRVDEWERRRRHQREPVYAIDAAPKPEYRPRSSSAAYLSLMKARFRIAKRDFA